MKGWEEMTIEEKLESLKEMVELLASLSLEMSSQMVEVIHSELEEFRKRYITTHSYLFGGDE